MKRLWRLVFLVISVAVAWGGGAAEGAAGSDRGRAVAESGRIIPPEEVRVEHYISEIDYGYPDPAGELGISFLAGHRQLSRLGQDEVVLIGLQGARGAKESLPPLNLVLLLDSSGSMSSGGKRALAIESVRVLLASLRADDTLAVIAYAAKPLLLQPAARRADIDPRAVMQAAESTLPYGVADLPAALRAARDEVKRKLRNDGVNRILLVSDGQPKSQAALQIASSYRKEGVSITTASAGLDADVVFMTDLAQRAGGSSRFLADMAKVDEVFGSDLSRTVVPVAYDLTMKLRLAEGVRILGTWGYEAAVAGNTATYALPALHHGDYETIVAEVRIPAGLPAGPLELGRLETSYVDRAGRAQRMESAVLRVEIGDVDLASGGAAEPKVLKAETILHVAQGLRQIGEIYPTLMTDATNESFLRNSIWTARGVEEAPPFDDAVQGELNAFARTAALRRQRCLDLSVSLAGEIRNTHARLQEEAFAGVLAILTSYIQKIGREMYLAGDVVAALQASTALDPSRVQAPLASRLASLVRELLLALEPGARGSLLYGGFAQEIEGQCALQVLLDDTVASAVGQSALRPIAGSERDAALARRGIALRDLGDTDTALAAAAELRADYVLTGRIIRLPASVIVFGRLLRRADSSVASVAQIVLPLDSETAAALQPRAP